LLIELLIIKSSIKSNHLLFHLSHGIFILSCIVSFNWTHHDMYYFSFNQSHCHLSYWFCNILLNFLSCISLFNQPHCHLDYQFYNFKSNLVKYCFNHNPNCNYISEVIFYAMLFLLINHMVTCGTKFLMLYSIEGNNPMTLEFWNMKIGKTFNLKMVTTFLTIFNKTNISHDN
jgi:hypothetical protein